MRKVLLGTTAMVAAGMLASAPSAIAAEKLKLGVSGYMEQWFGYTAQDGITHTRKDGKRDGFDFSGFNQIMDAEVFFKGSTELDNGLTVGVDVQLEGNTGGDTIDESYMWISGSFGQFILGSENSAQYKMGYGPSDFGIGLISGDQPSWVTPIADAEGDKINLTGKGYWRNPMGSSSWVEVLGMNDTQGISYYTPRFQGLQIGLTYTPEASGAGEDNGSMGNRDTDNTDAISAGINYKQSFDNATVGASLGYGTVTRTLAADDSDPTALSMGLSVGVGGFGIGASYATFDDSGVKNGEGYAVGANYAMGPWGLSLTYFHGERDGTMDDDILTDQAAANTVHLSAKYALGPGVTAKGTLGHASIESDDTAIDESVDDISATYLVVGVAVSY